MSISNEMVNMSVAVKISEVYKITQNLDEIYLSNEKCVR